MGLKVKRSMTNKNKLEELSRVKEKELEQELIEISDRLRSNVAKALIIIGSLSVGYLLYRTLFEPNTSTNKAKKTSSKSFSRFNKLSQSLKKEAVVLLLGIAKKKIQDYIDNNDEDTSGNPTQKKGE